MKKLSIEKDDRKPIIFLDTFTFIPGVGPDSDMDGHDLSGLTYSEEQRRDEFIDAFNDNYADVAEEVSFMGMPMIRVKAFYDDEIFGNEEDVNTAENDVEVEQEEVVDRTCPDANTAIAFVRDAIRDYVLCIGNISKQHRADIDTCVEYLMNYVKEHNDIDTIINNIDNNSLIQYSNTFERNGYVIDIKINKNVEAK